jgi:hypothetical protein
VDSEIADLGSWPSAKPGGGAVHTLLEGAAKTNQWLSGASFTIRAATWLESWRSRVGADAYFFLAGFFFSRFGAFLFPMP